MNIKYLEWESDFFNKKIYSVVDANKELNFKNINYDLIQAQVELSSKSRINSLETNGFKFQDLNITFRKKIQKSSFEKLFFGTPEDYLKLKKFSENFDKSRFLCFGNEKVEKFYSLWIKKSLDGSFDDCCLVYKENEAILGFVTVKKVDNSKGRIGLISVDGQKTKQGIGSKLIAMAEKYCFTAGIKELYISTQGTNLQAQNLYIKNNYYINKISAWYYLKGEKL